MRVDDPGHRSSGGLGGGDHVRVYAIGKPVHHILGDLITDWSTSGPQVRNVGDYQLRLDQMTQLW
jgi:hypothetical protein